jgi:hypothetical protein
MVLKSAWRNSTGPSATTSRHVKAGFSYLKAAEGLGVEPRACLVFEDAIVGVQAERAVPHFEAVRWPV